MSVKIKAPSAHEVDVAAGVFGALESTNHLVEAATEARDAAERISGTRLYAYATDPDNVADDALNLALAADPKLADDFRRLLQRTALVRFPQVAAASSGAVSGRAVEGYRISFEPSRAEPTQTYVIIDIFADHDVGPKCLFVCREGRQTQKIALPQGRNGVVQILLDNDDEALVDLRHPDSEVYLG